MEENLSRRNFIQKSIVGGIALATINPLSAWAKSEKPSMKLGLVTYQWAKDWDLPTLIANCVQTDVLGVELRTEHAHGVETKINAAQRAEVKKCLLTVRSLALVMVQISNTIVLIPLNFE